MIKYFMINLHERMLSTSVEVEPMTSWSPVGSNWATEAYNNPPPSLGGYITLAKTEGICPLAFQSRSLQYQCTYQVWWKSIDIYLSSHPEMKTQMWHKNWQSLLISNPKPDLHNINAHLMKIHWYFLKLLSRKKNTEGWMTDGQITHGCPMWNHNTPPPLRDRV